MNCTYFSVTSGPPKPPPAPLGAELSPLPNTMRNSTGLRKRREQAHAVADVADEVALPDHVDGAQRRSADVHGMRVEPSESKGPARSSPPSSPHTSHVSHHVERSTLLLANRATGRLQEHIVRLGRRALTAVIGTVNSEDERGMNDAEAATSTRNVPSTWVVSRCITLRDAAAAVPRNSKIRSRPRDRCHAPPRPCRRS